MFKVPFPAVEVHAAQRSQRSRGELSRDLGGDGARESTRVEESCSVARDAGGFSKEGGLFFCCYAVSKIAWWHIDFDALKGKVYLRAHSRAAGAAACVSSGTEVCWGIRRGGSVHRRWNDCVIIDICASSFSSQVVNGIRVNDKGL